MTSDYAIRKPLYFLAGLASMVVWLLPYRAPLWLDETVSYWEINGGITQIWSRTVQGLSFPAYYYLLWVIKEVFGSREVILRVPSVLAMLAATYILFLIAREFFDIDAAFVTCVIFVLQEDVAFAAIDVRPYAFGVLATNVAIYVFVLWTREKKMSTAVMLGISSAMIFYFHYLFGVLLPAFVVYYMATQRSAFKKDLKQVAVVIVSFFLAFSPVIPRLWYVMAGGKIFSFSSKPDMIHFALAFLPGATPYVLVGVAAIAFFTGMLKALDSSSASGMLLGILLAVVPTTILFATAAATPLQVFVGRYRLEAVPGIALTWGALLCLIRSKVLTQTFCVLLVGISIVLFMHSTRARKHGNTWKYALEFAQSNAGSDRAPLLICSDLTQADYQSMPIGTVSDSVLFAPLAYYKVDVPVIPLPRGLNDEAKRVGGKFLLEAPRTQRRFLALAYKPSYPTLDWLAVASQAQYSSRLLGKFDEVAVMEFRHKPGTNDE